MEVDDLSEAPLAEGSWVECWDLAIQGLSHRETASSRSLYHKAAFGMAFQRADRSMHKLEPSFVASEDHHLRFIDTVDEGRSASRAANLRYALWKCRQEWVLREPSWWVMLG